MDMLATRDRRSALGSEQPSCDTNFITSWKWSTDDEHVHWPRNKRLSETALRTIVPTCKSIIGHAASKLPVFNPHGVKRSALLYEITERTKELAKPRFNKTRCPELENEYLPEEEDPIDPRAADSNSLKFPKLSGRVLELSRPKVIFDKSTRANYGNVSPGALKAVATKRIVELSTPKKRQVRPPPIMKKRELIPCRARIITLAKPRRLYSNASGNKALKKSRRRTKIPVPSHSRRDIGKNSRDQSGHDQNYEGSGEMNRRKEKNCNVISSSSNRSVIVVGTICNSKKLKRRPR